MAKPRQPGPEKIAKRLEVIRPNDADQLHRFVRVAMGLNVPRTPIIPGNSAPYDYLLHAYFESPYDADKLSSKDAVVWANRGGGKTMLGAAATLLDLLFKPGIQVRILGGSFEQSVKMHEHLLTLLDRPWFRRVLDGQPTQRRVALTNGSRVQLLAGSQRSVRGVRVHKLRCDEVEEFDPAVWEAAQMVTRSGKCGSTYVHGAVEALSTMHRPFGLMAEITRAHESGSLTASKMFKWSAIDVIERCPQERPCDSCVLHEDCRGKAKLANGFISVDDLVQQWRRTSRRTWATEMMCQEPEVSDCVYPEFKPSIHVREEVSQAESSMLIGGMDFGLRSPTVMLWARVGKPDESTSQRTLHVVDEYIKAGETLSHHMEAIEKRSGLQGRKHCDWLGVDPAGNQRNSHTGISDVQALRGMGYRIRSKRSSLRDGIERIRRRLDRRTLYIHPRCERLIDAIRSYHFDTEKPNRQGPVKDGPDHLCDALRYMIVNLEAGSGSVTASSYL